MLGFKKHMFPIIYQKKKMFYSYYLLESNLFIIFRQDSLTEFNKNSG